MAESAIQDLRNCYSKQIIYRKTATQEKIFIYYPDRKPLLTSSRAHHRCWWKLIMSGASTLWQFCQQNYTNNADSYCVKMFFSPTHWRCWMNLHLHDPHGWLLYSPSLHASFLRLSSPVRDGKQVHHYHVILMRWSYMYIVWMARVNATWRTIPTFNTKVVQECVPH